MENEKQYLHDDPDIVRKAIYKCIIKQNERLKLHRYISQILCDLIMFRINGKKEKTGYVQATLNQITMGVQIEDVIEAIKEIQE